ncbi:J domain-containing protein [Mycena sanguinolenta]|uniref:J domain-containing protein n=1 Tax=Mycena sanguinolenta TaxID=230812 RepID=A0A8H6Y3V0_9AGAR|nr:J domain-containing protein [Mycena sanguinolenta]
MNQKALFNPGILNASIRDAALCLSDNQKADLLLHALGSLPQEGPSRAVFENAIQSCLQVSNLSPHNAARARILRARRRLAAGFQRGAQEDLQAALVSEPDNPEAKALLHHRSVAVEKLLAPVLPASKGRFSDEIWREIALWLPRRDLKTLLFVPNALSRVASQLLFRRLDLYLSVPPDQEEVGSTGAGTLPNYAQRSADILTHVIVHPAFGGFVRTLCIYSYATGKDESMAFQIGMLANALPRMVNLKNVYISALSDNTMPLLRVLQPVRIRGLSLKCPDAPVDLSHFECQSLHHLTFSTREGTQTATDNFIAQNRALRTISLHNMSWIFPSDAISLRNLTSISFSGHLPPSSTAIADILENGRQLDTLNLACTIECLPASQFRAHTGALPFLRHFALTVYGAARRPGSADLFPAVSEFLRARTELQTLALVVREETDQRTSGFDAAVWGVLPVLTQLKTLTITYPRDLAPSLAAWLIPRSLRALTIDYTTAPRDPVPFLDQLRLGIPPGLRSAKAVVEHGFPMVRVVRIAGGYWRVVCGTDETVTDVYQWPHKGEGAAREWLEWLGCEDAVRGGDLTQFPN